MGNGFVERAPWLACVVGQIVYLAAFAKGLEFTLIRAQGSDAVPDLKQAQRWLGLVAWEYLAEVLLILLVGRTIFPRWRRPDIIAHHLPFSLFIFAAHGVPSLWESFRWTQSAVLLTQGNEVLECFQTIGGEAALHWLLGIAQKKEEDAAKQTPGLVEKARLIYAMCGITNCALAETHDILREWLRAASATHSTGSLEMSDVLHVASTVAVLPALYLHVTLMRKYYRRVAGLFVSPAKTA
mmetsp:Transcript_21666/g.47367  ORF Transcript_21666/g.47367 Transcript_21666/m.47367 type:complete len:240 (-) Transcript_21666:71-790(-)